MSPPPEPPAADAPTGVDGANTGEDPRDDVDDELDDDGTDPPVLARLVLESELLATGRAAPTAIHLALWGPDCVGQDAWTLGRRWGWTDPELASLQVEGEQFILVLQVPGARWGEARAEVLANLLVALRPDEARERPAGVFAEALAVPAGSATPEQREAQRSLARVFGIRDPLFGGGQFPRGDEPTGPSPLYLDAWFGADAVNGLLPGSSAPVDEYAEVPTLVRLAWTAPGGAP